MLTEGKIVDRYEYEQDFHKKFSSFCEKNILSLSFYIVNGLVTIKDSSGLMTTPLSYQLDYETDIKKYIYDIGIALKKFYPKFYRYSINHYSNEELKDLLRTHTPTEIDELPPRMNKELICTIYRVVNKYNEINIIDHLDGNKKKVYKFSIPVMGFVKLAYENPKEAYDVFKTKARYLKEI